MSRGLTAAMVSAVTAGTVRPILLYQGEFSSGTLRLTTNSRDVVFNGNTFIAAGTMLSITPIEEVSEIKAVSFSVALNGDLASVIAIALASCRQGLAGTVWIGLLDDSGAVIADPFQCFSGRLDVPDVVDSGTECRISVKYESRLADLQKARERRYTSEDQQIDYPTDLGFDYVPSLQDKKIIWGPA